MTQTLTSLIFGAFFGITWSIFDGDYGDFCDSDSDED